MNKKKLGKVTGVAAASFLIAGTTALTAFAAMPSGTAVIGDKAYDLNYVNDPANEAEIVAAMQKANFKVYVKDFAGNWIVNETETALTDLSVIPVVEYKNAKGEVVKYDAKDGDIITDELKVTGVSAINANTLTVTGTGLDKLTKEDFTIANNSIVSITPNADKTSATVVLTYKNLPNAEYAVSIKVGDTTQEFKYTFGLVVSTIDVNAATVDDNKSNQALTIKINGVDMDVDTLNAAGYIVNFVAIDSAGADATAALFSDANTGKILAPAAVGDYKVYASVHKETFVVSSQYSTIKVRNIDQVATTINKYELTNTTTADNIVQTSNTLVVNETAKFTSLNVTANGDTFDTNADVTDVKTSAPGVVSVDTTTGVLTANAPGTATITVAYGDVTKTITFTVTNTARTLAKATASNTAFTLINGSATAKTKAVDIKTYDQYGDPFEAVAYLTHSAGIVTAADSVGAVVLSSKPAPIAASAYASGAATSSVTFTADAAGSGSVYVVDGSGKPLTSIAIKVTAVDNISKTVLEVLQPLATETTKSKDNNLDLYKDNTVVYNLNKYTTENVFNGKADTSKYYVVYNPKVVSIDADGDTTADTGTAYLNGLEKIAITHLTDIDVIATGKGSTDLVVYDTATNQEAGRVRITVTDSSPKITGVAFKTSPTINYVGKIVKASDVLTLTASSDDDIVSGITLSSASGHATRITEAAVAPANAGVIYIDKNDDGKFNPGDDYALGQVQIKVVSGFEGTLTATLNDAITGTNATDKGDKATVLFTIASVNSTTGEVDATPTISASTTVTVDVK